MTQRMSETLMELRNVAMRGLVQKVNDSGAMQLVDVLTQDGMLRAGIEVYQFAGLATAPVAQGAVVILLAMGADPGDLIALPPIVPAARFGAMLAGESVVYNLSDGSRIAFRDGGAGEWRTSASVLIETQTVTVSAAGGVTVSSAAGIVLNGNTTVAGTLSVSGSASVGGNLDAGGDISDSVRSLAADRQIYDQHDHTIAGVGTTNAPAPQM